MKVKIFNANNDIKGIQQEVDKWTDNNDVVVINVTFDASMCHDTYDDGRICNQWMEYTLAVVYTLN